MGIVRTAVLGSADTSYLGGGEACSSADVQRMVTRLYEQYQREKQRIFGDNKRFSERTVAERIAPVRIGSRLIGGGELCWIAGPSHVQSPEQMVAIGAALARFDAGFMRARFRDQGLGAGEYLAQQLRLARATATRYSLKLVSEIRDCEHLKLLVESSDMLEVAPMQSNNLSLLRELSYTDRTVVLHRNPLMTIDEFLRTIAHLERGQIANVILAESGVKSFDPRRDRMIDVAAVMTLKRETPYPVLVDCSSVSRDVWYAERIATAAITAGADGILLDVIASPRDGRARDGATVTTDEMGDLLRKATALKFTLDAMRLSPAGN